MQHHDPVLRFRHAIARYFDQPLTPEIAAAIEEQAFTEPDQSIDPDRFPPAAWGDYLIRLERFDAVLPELHPLHAQHWRETEKHRHGFELRPNFEAVLARARAGRVLQFTARRQGELAGHLRMFLGESLHTSTLMAEEDTLFLLASHRPNGFLVMAMLRYAEAVLRQLGVREIRANSKVLNDADVLMRRMRYRHVAHQFVKFLEGESDVL